jgi:hypothetical protein
VKQDGYTAAETLVALAIIGMAMGGLATSIVLIVRAQARTQARLSDAALQQAATDRIEQLLIPQAPFRSDDPARLAGDERGFEVACGDQRCSVRLEAGKLLLQGAGGPERQLRLPTGQTGSTLSYVGFNSVSARWPPLPAPPPAPSLEILRAVVVNDAGGGTKPVLVAKIWTQQRYDCEYDIVIQDCRRVGS